MLTAITLTVIVLPLLYLIEPIAPLRFGRLYNQRFGHLALNTELFLRRQKYAEVKSKKTYFFVVWNAANRELVQIFKRYMNLYENKTLARIFNAFFPILSKTRFYTPLPIEKPNDYYFFNRTEKVIKFSQTEESRGEALLEQMGVEKDSFTNGCYRLYGVLNREDKKLKNKFRLF